MTHAVNLVETSLLNTQKIVIIWVFKTARQLQAWLLI